MDFEEDALRREGTSEHIDPQADEKGTESQAFKIAKMLTEIARPKAESFTQNYDNDLRYFLGEGHWPSISSWTQGSQSAWQNRSVRNYLHAVVSHKAAVVLGAEPVIRAHPVGAPVDLSTRQKIAAAIKDE